MLWREVYTRYVKLLATWPLFIIVLVLLSCIAFILVSVLYHPLPDFSEPQAGFETRGTDISSRIVAWENLIDSVSHLGPLTSNPLEWRRFENLNRKWRDKVSRKKKSPSPGRRRSLSTKSSSRKSSLQRQRRDEVSVLSRLLDHKHIGWLCGDPLPDYARVVFESSRNRTLFSRESIISMCSLDHRFLRSARGFTDICETKGPAHCCPGWSLGGYVALISNKTSCFTLHDEDIDRTFSLLKNCSKFYHSGELVPNCHLSTLRPCNQIPSSCTQFNAVYHILHFLVDKKFLSTDDRENERLRHVVSFLPVARSSITLEYFRPIIESMPISDGVTQIIAMELGLKESLFNEYMIEDSVYLILGGCLIVICVLSYTASLFITLVTILTIVFSLGSAYFIYTFVLNIQFFPFMNALAVVIALGVGSDDTFILVKSWNSNKDKELEDRLRSTLSSSTLSIFVTSLTTSGALLVSYVSNITSIKCFSLFASIAILCNFILMLTWTPACLSFHSKYLSCSRILKLPISGEEMTKSNNIFSFLLVVMDWTQIFFEKILPYIVIRPRLFWILTFGTLGIFSLFVVLHTPGLKLPDKEQFHLFPLSHPFERYDSEFRSEFGFEISASRESSLKLPLTFVWGVKPTDNGNHLNPGSKGTLLLDPYFDITAPASQRWLLQFCVQLRRQSFYSSPSFGPPLLSNCFIETFKSWMERRCVDGITKENRYPCCQKSQFPFEKSIFQKCILQSIENLYSTPKDFWIPGMAGPKFNISTNQVSAIIIEYESNTLFSYSHDEMFKFYESVNNWFKNEMMISAPPGLKGGFFLSHLGFFDVQNSLSEGTLSSVLLATGISGVVLLISSRCPILALFCAINVANIIFGTLAILVFLGWKLNILESVAVTLTVGLSADFALHYGVSYVSSGNKRDREVRVIQSLSSMAGPVSMAALTTICSGITLLPTRVLPYIQIGTFIIVVMCVSWIYSTFFLQALIRTYGTRRELDCFNSIRNCSTSVNKNDASNGANPRESITLSDPPPINLIQNNYGTPIEEDSMTLQPILRVAYVKEASLKNECHSRPPTKKKKNNVHLDGTATLPSPRSSLKIKAPSSQKAATDNISKSLTKLCTVLVHSEVADRGLKTRANSPTPHHPKKNNKLPNLLKKINRKSKRRRRGSLPLSFVSPASSFENISFGSNGLPRPVSFSYLINDDGEIESEKERRKRIARIGSRFSSRDLARMLLQKHRHVTDSSFPEAQSSGILRKSTPKKNEESSPMSSTYRMREAPTEEDASGLSWNDFRRHPSTSTILFTDDSYDPKPILPNKTPDTPDIWIPRTILKA